MKTKFLGLTIISVFLISAIAFAQPQSNQAMQNRPNDRRAMMMKKHRMDQKDRPNFLTEEQKEKAKELRLVSAKNVKPLRNKLNELMAHQKTLTTADNADLKAINANIDKISAVKAEIAKIKAKQHQAFRSMLTEEQLMKFDMMQEKRGKKGRRPEMKDGRRGGERPQRG